MSEVNKKHIYEQIVKTIRDDLEYIRKSNSVLISKAGNLDRLPEPETRAWIKDVFC